MGRRTGLLPDAHADAIAGSGLVVAIFFALDPGLDALPFAGMRLVEPDRVFAASGSQNRFDKVQQMNDPKSGRPMVARDCCWLCLPW